MPAPPVEPRASDAVDRVSKPPRSDSVRRQSGLMTIYCIACAVVPFRFLGSGKTTVLNKLLTNAIGKRIAVSRADGLPPSMPELVRGLCLLCRTGDRERVRRGVDRRPAPAEHRHGGAHGGERGGAAAQRLPVLPVEGRPCRCAEEGVRDSRGED